MPKPHLIFHIVIILGSNSHYDINHKFYIWLKNCHIMNPVLEIVRQRIFMDHTAMSKTFINEEYTIRSLDDGINNIMIEKDDFLPNLHVFDSDGTELPIIKTELTIALQRGQLAAETDSVHIERLQKYIHKLETRETHLLWIKLPKSMNKNDVRVINLKYDAMKEPKPRRNMTIEYTKKLSHSVVYIIKKPEDYDIKDNPRISYQDASGDRHTIDSWNLKQNTSFEIHETYSSTSLIIRPEKICSLVLTYSFTANKNVISFPLLAVALLTLSALSLIIMNHCDSNCIVSEATIESLKKTHVQISFGIVAASLVIPGLIRNEFIRNSYKFAFLIPLTVAIISILFGN